jgi:hypothetical protein
MSVTGWKSSDERIEDVDFARDICDLADLGRLPERFVRPDGMAIFGLYSSPRTAERSDAVRPECIDRGALRTDADRDRALICITSGCCMAGGAAAAGECPRAPLA